MALIAIPYHPPEHLLSQNGWKWHVGLLPDLFQISTQSNIRTLPPNPLIGSWRVGVQMIQHLSQNGHPVQGSLHHNQATANVTPTILVFTRQWLLSQSPTTHLNIFYLKMVGSGMLDCYQICFRSAPSPTSGHC